MLKWGFWKQGGRTCCFRLSGWLSPQAAIRSRNRTTPSPYKRIYRIAYIWQYGVTYIHIYIYDLMCIYAFMYVWFIIYLYLFNCVFMLMCIYIFMFICVWIKIAWQFAHIYRIIDILLCGNTEMLFYGDTDVLMCVFMALILCIYLITDLLFTINTALNYFPLFDRYVFTYLHIYWHIIIRKCIIW